MMGHKDLSKIRRIMTKFIFISYPILVLIILFFIYMDFLDPNRPSKRRERLYETRKIGIDIVVALEAYHNEHNQYPKVLDALLPKYLNKVEPPTWGNSGWLYTSGGQGFYLETGYKMMDTLYPAMYYYSSERQWRVND
jgi:hypothetical protein